jgi:hypothetical protein
MPIIFSWDLFFIILAVLSLKIIVMLGLIKYLLLLQMIIILIFELLLIIFVRFTTENENENRKLFDTSKNREEKPRLRYVLFVRFGVS